ncbi:acidic leucine-rich nuclear phosphoprotein 32-related protein 1-like [Phragmites australis]|uniref:acidic leucine-rich nuclear phosphoprotein 32-related protein 1-like n=1 Tax=Phragmites australis TaxID=29695 RepID=UPI002D789DED|nr:acidic leucine-rich nuclear phosphoprotein 32-related protein 1-like [Phragmites australis]
MLRQSSSRNHRSKKLRPRHSFQLFLLVAVGIWLVYRLSHYYSRRRAVVVETDGNNGMGDGEPARRRLGRKGFVDFAGVASEDDIVGVRGGSDAGSEDVERGGASSDDPLNKAGDHEEGDGDEQDQEADGDDGVEDADDGLAADEEEDGRDFQSQNGNSEEELMKTMNGEKLTELTNGIAMALGDSALKNTSVDVSLHGRGRTGNVPKKSLVHDFAVRAPEANNEKPANNASADANCMINQNGTAGSVPGHGISS